MWHPLVPFKTVGAQGHCCWCPRKAKDVALTLWLDAVGKEPVKSREVQAAGGSHHISPLNNTSLETLLVTSSAIPALDVGSLQHFSISKIISAFIATIDHWLL